LTFNDSDSDGDLLRVQSIDAIGDIANALTLNLDGTVSWNGSAFGRFSYTVSDGAGGVDTASVYIREGAGIDPLNPPASSPQATSGTDVLFFDGTLEDVSFRYFDPATGFVRDFAFNGYVNSTAYDGLEGNDFILMTNFADVIVSVDEGLTAVHRMEYISAGDGNDFLSLERAGPISVFLGGGDDFVRTGNYGDTIFGSDGNDVILGGAGADQLEGNADHDLIYGEEGDDRIFGGLESDTLSGGQGDDTFVFLSPAEGGDTIGDFAPGADKIEVSASGFGGGLAAGALAVNRLVNGTVATETFGQFLYNSATGQLAWDADGTGAGVAVLLATLSGAPAITAADFTVVASLPPLIIDLDGNGVNLVSGVAFDFDGDGADEVGGWASAGDGFLALDRNGDGLIAGSSEISFIGDLPGAASDLEGLRAFDSNKDGLLSAADKDFIQFRLWQDANTNGVSDAGELRTLGEAGILSIGLDRSGVPSSWEGGDILGYASVTFSDGSTTVAADTMLHYTEQSPEKRPMPVNDELLAGASEPLAAQGELPVASELRPQPFDVEFLSDATFDFSGLSSPTLPYMGVRVSNQLVDFDWMDQHKWDGNGAQSDDTGSNALDFHTQDMFQDATQGSIDGAAALGVDVFRVV
jgi:hypothetical protein